jgi:glycosyltransferase involved in cell wall biosynthesis
MRFIFFHHEAHGPFPLSQLHMGGAPYGGSVARLRFLFWLSARGHDVSLVGNVETGDHDGVRALAGEEGLRHALDASDQPGILVLSNLPSEDLWKRVRPLVTPQMRLVLWAGNSVDWTWLRRAHEGEIHRVVCVSRQHRDEYRLYPGFEKIEVSYSGVDTDLIEAAPLRPGGQGPLVLSTSIPRRSKGFHNLLRAWTAVRREVPDARLWVCGSARMHAPDAQVGPTGMLDADLEAEFPHFFADHPSSTEEAGIELRGTRPLPEVFADLRAADVAVVNSNWRGAVETFCRSAVEAQVAGTPVIGAARGSLPEVVGDGETGLLVDRESAEDLAAAIVAVLVNRPLRERLGAAGPVRARPFADYALIAPDWEGIAERAWSGRDAPSSPNLYVDVLRKAGVGSARLRLRDLFVPLLGR